MIDLRDHPVHTTRRRSHEIDDRYERPVVKSLARRDKLDVICRANGSLRCGIEASQRLDHIPDELHSHWLDIRRRQDIDDTAADCEGAMLVNRILAGKSSVYQQVSKLLRLDF